MAQSDLPRFANLRVILALMLREMTTRYGKSSGGYIWAFAEPLGMIAILSAVFSVAVRTPALGTNFPLFFATGYLSFIFYAELAQFASSAVVMNKPLLNYPRVTPIDAILARCLLQFATLSVVTVVILVGILEIFEINTIFDFGSILKAIGLAALLGIGTGVMNTYIFTIIPTYMNVWRIISRPLFLISGVFFTMESMPRAIQDVLWWNPLVHATALMRKGFYPSYDANWIAEWYIGGMGLLLLAFGLFFVYGNRTYITEQK